MFRKFFQSQTRRFLAGALIICAPFSLFPSFALPLANFTSFRAGVYQLLAAAFVVSSIPVVYKNLRQLLGDRWLLVPLLLLSLSVVVGMFGATDLKRGALMGCSILFLLTVLLSGYVAALEMRLHANNKLVRAVLIAAIFYGCISILQLLIATASSWNMGLCKGCGEMVFGFVRVNGFAAEPLFWANALVPFIFIAFNEFIKKRTKLSIASLSMGTLSLVLTFARGAYAAVAVGLILYVIITYVKKMHTFKELISAVGTVILSGIIAWALLISSAVIQYPGAPYIAYNTFRGMVEHVTLGTINLPIKSEIVGTDINSESSQEFISEGLIEASSNERLDSAHLALDAWRHSIRTLFIGVGPGNLGPFVVANISPNAPSNLTVYIFYILILSELGVIGLGALALLIVTALRRTIHVATRESIVIASIVTAFAVQYFFFGSYINVVYIWFWLGIALAAGQKISTKQA